MNITEKYYNQETVIDSSRQFYDTMKYTNILLITKRECDQL